MKKNFFIFILLVLCSHFCFATNLIELKKVGIKITVPNNFIRISSDQVESYKKKIENSINICEGTKQALDKALSNPDFELVLNTLDLNESIFVVKFPKLEIDKILINDIKNKIKKNCLDLKQTNFDFLNSAEGKIPIGSYFSTLAKVQSQGENYFSESFFISSSRSTYLITFNSSKIVGNYEIISSISELSIEENDIFIDKYKYFYNAGDILQSVSVLDEAIKTSPNTPKYYFLRANTLIKINQYNAALKDIKIFLKFEKNNIDAMVIKGVIEFSLKKYDESIEDLTKAKLTYSVLLLANKPFESTFGLPYMSSLIAMNYDAKEDYISALRNITDAISTEQEEPSYYFLRANIYLKKEDFKEAISDLTKSINLGYKNIGKVYFTRAAAYFSINEITKGCEDLVLAEKSGYKDVKINSLKQFCK